MMKKLLPFLIVPIMISCVSQKKYAELENQNRIAYDYNQKLDQIIEMRADEKSTDENMQSEIKVRQLKEQMAAMKSLDQMISEGRIQNMTIEELSELLRRHSEETAHMSVVNERDMMTRTDTRKSVEKEAIAMLMRERIGQKHPAVSVSNVFETCLINVPNSVLFGSGNTVTNDGLDILQNIRQTADFREGVKITIKLPMIGEEIKEDDRKKGNSIYEGLKNVSVRMQKDISVEFSSDLKTEVVIFEIL